MKEVINKGHLFAIFSILCLAMNLRAPFTSLAPVLEQIMQAMSLDASQAGLLTALPLLTFAIVSPISPLISKKFGLNSSLILALLFIASGIILRSAGAHSTLFTGTILIGAGIALGNVLLPAVVKSRFPGRVAVVTSLYTFSMGVAATLASSLMVPVSGLNIFGFSGWQLALSCTLMLPVVALFVWLPQMQNSSVKKRMENQNGAAPSKTSLIKSPIAWQVTLALGLNSFTFYSFAGWLPKILGEYGYSELDAGYLYGLLQFSTTIPGLALIPFLKRNRGHTPLVMTTALLVVVGISGLILSPHYAVLWVVLFGIGNCSTFIISLSFIGLRTENSSDAVRLSGMSQTVGYALAAVGPTLLGAANEVTHNWTAPLSIVLFAAVCCTMAATLASRDRVIK